MSDSPYRARLVFLAERETIASQRLGEALLARTPHQPLAQCADGRIEVFALTPEGWDQKSQRPVLFAWYTCGREEANLRYANDLDLYFETDAYVALYRHYSKQDIPRLTIHPVGNCATPPDPDYGPAHSLAWSSARLMHDALHHIHDVVREHELVCDYSYEITHHNPTGLKAPIHFLEVGDGPTHWENMALVEAQAEVALRLITKSLPAPKAYCMGISHGDHYAKRFTRLALEHGYAFGHIFPTHALPGCEISDFESAIQKTVEPVEYVFYKRLKGMSALQRRRFEGMLQRQNITLQKSVPSS